MRPPDSIERKDVTLATWQILKIVDAVRISGGKLTMGMLANLARGLQGGSYEVSQGGRNGFKGKVNLDLETIAGGPVDMNKTVGLLIPCLTVIGRKKQPYLQQIEHLIIRLLTRGYLQEEYHETAYNRVVYIAPGPLATRLNHHTRQSIKGEVKRKLEFLFTSSKIKSGTKRKSGDVSQSSGSKKRKVLEKSSKAKGKMKAVEPDDQDDFGVEDEYQEDIFLSDDEVPAGVSQKALDKNVPDDMYESFDENLSDDNEDSINYGWSHSLLEEPRPAKPYSINQTKASKRLAMNIIQEGDHEVVELLSD